MFPKIHLADIRILWVPSSYILSFRILNVFFTFNGSEYRLLCRIKVTEAVFEAG